MENLHRSLRDRIEASMTPKSIGLADPIHDYLLRFGLREPEPLQRLREETVGLPGVNMLLAPEQGQFMALLVRLTGTERYLEIGTYTGYSALAIALALPQGGKVVTCDIDGETAAVAQAHWRRANAADKIDFRQGAALQSLDAMIRAGQRGCFDMAFIDADKENLPAYYEHCHQLVRLGGLILADNTLWGGAVAEDDHDPATEAVRAFNVAVHGDVRVEMVLLPVGDGLTVARKLL
jgi:predicted O-methyltransferase YrrM